MMKKEDERRKQNHGLFGMDEEDEGGLFGFGAAGYKPPTQ